MKKKRIQVIKTTVILGVTLPILFALMSAPKGNGGIVVIFILAGVMMSKLVSIYIKNQHVVFTIFIITHLATYLFLGWIIARLVYPNKKVLPEPDTPSEPAQD